METTKRKRRRFTPEFRAKVVIEALSCQSSEAELCCRHNLTEAQLSQWKLNSSKALRASLNPRISRPMPLRTHCAIGATR